MIEDTETVSDKYARFMYWKEVYEELGGRQEPPNPKFFTVKHLLYNASTWDVEMLLAYGVKPSNILTLFSDPELAAVSEDASPSVPAVVGDLTSFCKRHHRKIGAAFLNMNAPLSDGLFGTVFDVLAHGMKDTGVLGVSFTVGGETGRIASEIEEQIAEIRNFVIRMQQSKPHDVISDFAHAMLSGAIVPVRDSTYRKINSFMKLSTLDADYALLERELASLIAQDMTKVQEAESSISRNDYYNYVVVNEGTRRRNGLAPRRVFYREDRESARCFSLGIVHRAFTGESVQKYRSRFGGFVSASRMKGPMNCTITAEQFKKKVAETAWKNGLDELSRGDEGLKSSLVPQFFSLPRRTVLEWAEELQKEENNDGSDE